MKYILVARAVISKIAKWKIIQIDRVRFIAPNDLFQFLYLFKLLFGGISGDFNLRKFCENLFSMTTWFYCFIIT